MKLTLQSILPRPAFSTSSPEAQYGGPVADARVDPVIGDADLTTGHGRLELQRNLHLYGSKTDPATAFSHFWEATPSPLAAGMMGLAAQRDQIERLTSRKDTAPFPGVELGHVPAFAPAPATNPVTPPFGHFAHRAHLGGHADTVGHSHAGRKKFGQ